MKQLYQVQVATGNHGGPRLPSGFDDTGHDPQRNWRDGQVINAFTDADIRAGRKRYGRLDKLFHALVYANLTKAEADELVEAPADGKGRRVKRIDWRKVVSAERLARNINNTESVDLPELSQTEVDDLESGLGNARVTPLLITDAETLDYSKLKAVARG